MHHDSWKKIVLAVICLIAATPQEVSPFFIGRIARALFKSQARIESDLRRASFDLAVTEDGYILTLHRIPFSKGSPLKKEKTRPAVLLQHGLLCSSADWVVSGPEKGLAYALADGGYDVWLGNYRGNLYSRNHRDLDPDSIYDDSFWQFSWDQCGMYDIPAMVDYVLNKTGNAKLHYIGHSMGTTGFMVLMNEKPDYSEKVIMANFLAPVAYVKHITTPVRVLTMFLGNIQRLFAAIGYDEFLPNNWLINVLSRMLCRDPSIKSFVCKNVMFIFGGFDRPQMNSTLLPTILRHTPAGASTKMVVQYGQQVRSGRFAKYDYGRDTNMQVYGQLDPPEYHVENVKVPVATYWGKNDWLSHKLDYTKLLGKLPNVFDNYTIPFDKWNHLDFMWAIDLDKYLIPRLLKNMDSAEALHKENKL